MPVSFRLRSRLPGYLRSHPRAPLHIRCRQCSSTSHGTTQPRGKGTSFPGFLLGLVGSAVGGFLAVDYAQQKGHLLEIKPWIDSIKQATGIDPFAFASKEQKATTETLPDQQRLKGNASDQRSQELKFLQPQSAVVSDVQDHGLCLTIWLNPKAIVEECAAVTAQTVLMLQEESTLNCDAACGFSQDMMQRFSYRIPSGVFLPFHQGARSTKNAKIPATGGAIFVHCKSASQSDCYEFGKVLLDRLESIDAVQRAEAVFGFKYKGAHDREEDSAAGFDISGVKSCASVHDTPEQRSRQALVETTGGSYLLLQQWRHKYVDPDRLKQIFYESPHAHVNKVRGYHPDCSKLEVVRQSLAVSNLDVHPSSRGTDSHASGLFFVGYSKDPMVFSYMLDRMAGIPIRGRRKDRRQPDALFQMADCVRSTVVYVPSLQQLRAIAQL